MVEDFMNKIEPIFLTTTFIERFKDDKENGSATGFFFAHNESIFLVTNKHVIYGDDYHSSDSVSKVNKFRLLLHTNPNDLSQNESLDIDLFEKGKKIWLEHKNTNIDVILIPLKLNRNKYLIVPVDKTLLEFENLVIQFEKIFVMGYPYGWFDKKTNLPITRVGHLSSPFRIPFYGMPVMLGDVETHKGMSGGPVYMELKDYTTQEGDNRTKHLGTTKIILAGIHSGQPRWDLIDKRTGKISETVSHSLIFIWFSDLILEVIAQNID